MTTKIKIKIFDGENWETVWVKEMDSNINPNEVSIHFENDEWLIWGVPEDFIEKEKKNEEKLTAYVAGLNERRRQNG